MPTALNTGSNSGELFCSLFGTHVPFSDAQLDALYRNHGHYISAVVHTDRAKLGAGYLLPADALENLRLSPQCGFSSTHHGNRLTEDEQWRKLALVVEVAREVWG